MPDAFGDGGLGLGAAARRSEDAAAVDRRIDDYVGSGPPWHWVSARAGTSRQALAGEPHGYGSCPRVPARAGTSRPALDGLLAFWFATCLLAPRLGTDLAGFVHPAPLATAFDAAIEEDFAQMIPFPQRVEAVTERVKLNS